MFDWLAKFKLIPEDSIWLVPLALKPRAQSSCTVRNFQVSGLLLSESVRDHEEDFSAPFLIRFSSLWFAEMTQSLRVLHRLLLYLDPLQRVFDLC